MLTITIETLILYFVSQSSHAYLIVTVCFSVTTLHLQIEKGMMLQAPPPKLTTTFSSSDFSTDSDTNNSSSKQSSGNTDAPWELSPRAKLALTQVFEKYSSNGNGMSLQDIAVYSQACHSSSINNVNPEMVSASTLYF
jgi:hypothetical protein